MTKLPYHLHLTSEVEPDGSIVYCAEHKELPCFAVGATPEEAIEKLGRMRDAYLAVLQKRGEHIPRFVDDAQVHDWVPKQHKK